MNEEEQNIAIAQACGWKKYDGLNCKLYHYRCWTPPGKQGQSWRFNKVVPPDYTADLNSMHEAEKILNNSEQAEYAEMIAHVSNGRRALTHFTFFIGIHASAKQRAEAFLRTRNLWKD